MSFSSGLFVYTGPVLLVRTLMDTIEFLLLHCSCPESTPTALRGLEFFDKKLQLFSFEVPLVDIVVTRLTNEYYLMIVSLYD